MSGVNDGSRAEWKGLWGIKLRNAGRSLVDLVLPPASLDGVAGVSGMGLSAGAFSCITFLEDPVCDGCGLPFEYELEAGQRCLVCTQRPHIFARARAACLYDEHSRGLILGLKHGDEQSHAALFARWISRSADPLIRDCDVIIPVPLHPLRLLRRRFNQCAEIARPLARQRGLVYLPDTLKRTRVTATQGGRSLRGRRLNVKGAFRVSPRQASRVAGKRVLLLDDVLTTGATADACARALLDAGALAVDLAVIAGVHGAREVPK